jgi:hypothetical protein
MKPEPPKAPPPTEFIRLPTPSGREARTPSAATPSHAPSTPSLVTPRPRVTGARPAPDAPFTQYGAAPATAEHRRVLARRTPWLIVGGLAVVLLFTVVAVGAFVWMRG